MDPRTRGQYLHKLAGLIRESTSEFAYLEAISTGRPVSTYFDSASAVNHFDYFAEAGWGVQGTSSLNSRDHLNLTLKQPYGVVGAIIPWNIPLAAFSFKVAPALAAGNTVVIKSSEKAPLTVSFAMLYKNAVKDMILLTPCYHFRAVPLRCQADREGGVSPRCRQRPLRLRKTSW